MQPEAEQRAAARGGINAVVDEEGISPSEEEVLDALPRTAGREGGRAQERRREDWTAPADGGRAAETSPPARRAT